MAMPPAAASAGIAQWAQSFCKKKFVVSNLANHKPLSFIIFGMQMYLYDEQGESLFLQKKKDKMFVSLCTTTILLVEWIAHSNMI